jgi:peptide/nickel transport system substrate-binding protein
MKSLTTRLLVGMAIGLFFSAMASAETIRWARAGDSLTMDPHAQNEGPTHALAHQIYDSLLQRDMSGAIIPSLATEWAALQDNPNVWRLKLRKGVVLSSTNRRKWWPEVRGRRI